MSTLKEAIEKKFDTISPSAEEQFEIWRKEYQKEKDIYPDTTFGFKENLRRGADWQREQLKAEVLPILLECVNAFEEIGFKTLISGEDSDGKGGPCRISVSNSRNEKIIIAQQALERLRKWSEL